MPVPNRRWPRFTMRTMFVAVTVFCVWLAHNVSIVKDRQRAIESLSQASQDRSRTTHIMVAGNGDDYWMVMTRRAVPWLWRLLGTRAVASLSLDPRDFSYDDAVRYAALFPEAAVERYENGGTKNF